MTTSLHGLNILVTRAAHQAEPLCKLIQQAGGHAIHYPIMDIVPSFDHPSIAVTKSKLEEFDLIIFISANAVHYGVQTLNQLPPCKLACVGQQTAKALNEHGYPADLVPTEDFTSEGLLNLPELQSINGQNVLIIRGEGGRETLKQHLLARGAYVHYLECYRRQLPNLDYSSLHQKFRNNEIDIITVSSTQSLNYLLMACDLDELKQQPLIAINSRMAEIAKQLGFKNIAAIADNASDGAILEAIYRYIESKP